MKSRSRFLPLLLCCAGLITTPMDTLKKEQMAKAGKRLADLLQSIWP